MALLKWGGTWENAYILDLVSKDRRLEFQFLPTDAVESKSAKYTGHDILGRSTPIFAYSGSEARSLRLTLQFYVAPFQRNDSPSLNDIADHVNFLRSLVYPDYQTAIEPPHKVIVRLGDLVAMEAICQNYSLSFPSNVWDVGNTLPGLPYHCAVSLDFLEVRGIPPDFSDIQNGDSGHNQSS
jgi:hypothetical protein